MTLSYDFAFLGILYNSFHEKKCCIKRQRCVIHPFKKRNCLCCGSDLDYTAAAAVISVYYKICDEIEDNGFLKSLPFRLLRRIMKKGFKKASDKLPQIAHDTEKCMKMQFELEHEKCTSIDKACEPTAKIMSSIAGNISDDENFHQELGAFGYHLGRFIYLADAYDDIEKDQKKGSYNPLLLNFDDTDSAKQFALENINMSLGQASEHYCKCGFKKFKGIMDNIVYLGLPNFRIINKKKTWKEKNKITEI